MIPKIIFLFFPSSALPVLLKILLYPYLKYSSVLSTTIKNQQKSFSARYTPLKMRKNIRNRKKIYFLTIAIEKLTNDFHQRSPLVKIRIFEIETTSKHLLLAKKTKKKAFNLPPFTPTENQNIHNHPKKPLFLTITIGKTKQSDQ